MNQDQLSRLTDQALVISVGSVDGQLEDVAQQLDRLHGQADRLRERKRDLMQEWQLRLLRKRADEADRQRGL